MLETAIQNNTLHHAIFFEGENAYPAVLDTIYSLIGKRDVENNPDVYSYTQDAIKVDDIREMQYSVSLKAFHDSQIVIVRADALNVAAANALLKSLEEPKENLYFFLYGQSRHNLLATVKSRVQIIKVESKEQLSILAKERGILIESLPIYCEMGLSVEQLELYQDRADEWVSFIQEYAELSELIGVLRVGDWQKQFADREEQRIALKLLQHYGKSLLLKKKGQYSLWSNMRAYEWHELVHFNEQVNLLANALRSNGQFVLHLEEFYRNK